MNVAAADREPRFRVAAALIAACVLVLTAASSAVAAPSKKVEIAKKVTVKGPDLTLLRDLANDPARGKAAPKLIGVSFTGKKVTFAPGGSPKVIVFLAHWCPHCQAEVPRIVQVASSGGTEGVDVVGVATGTSKTRDNYPPSEWLKREKWPFPVLVDTADTRAARAYGLSAYPFLVFVSPAGTVAARVSGELSPAALRGVLQAFAAGRVINFTAG